MHTERQIKVVAASPKTGMNIPELITVLNTVKEEFDPPNNGISLEGIRVKVHVDRTTFEDAAGGSNIAAVTFQWTEEV